MSTGPNGRTAAEWEELGKSALLDLLAEKFVVPWAEAEARISVRGWKDFDKVQPVQLGGARRSLREEGRIVEDISSQRPPVHLIRLEYPPGEKRRLERLTGSKRKLYRKYLSWAGDQVVCGKHGERVVFDSLTSAASDAGLYVPQQTPGAVAAVRGVPIARGPADGLAHVMDRQTALEVAVLLIEVKNINTWIYPRAPELWQLLVKAATLATTTPVVPLLLCVRYAYLAQRMAADIGFFLCAMRDQIFSPSIDADEFASVAEEFGLLMVQHAGPSEPITSFLRSTLRRSPPMSPPYGEDIEWCRRQAERFQVIAPVILDHSVLAEDLNVDTRRQVFRSFATNAVHACTWETLRGWS
jgi:hypothetical protein